ncbi:TRAP transporter small permease [Falsirhodobacter deserti]|uniref:TRAP transporter small permease n=1 Tax=Falsirhodobacter deserti TaxID=1365611 RepID=UPI001F4E519A|nr:TRAP transporter small permease [Falsirhodobacter deserti]
MAWLSRISAALSGAVLLAVTAMLLIDVLGRAAGHPLFGAQDVAQMAMVLITFGTVAALDRQNGQIRVDLLKPAMPRAVRRAVSRLSLLLGAAIYATLAWTLWDAAALSSMLSLGTNILGLPRAPFQYALAAFALIAALNAVLLAATGDHDD